MVITLEEPMEEQKQATIDESAVDAALAPKPDAQVLPDPDIFPAFQNKPY